MDSRRCELILDEAGNIKSTEPLIEGLPINLQIKEDKKYGTFKPRNNKYFTFKVYANDKELTHKKTVRAVIMAFQRWIIYTNLKVKRARNGEIPDFRIYFKNTTTDPELKKNTIMYHYYPINDLNNKNRGKCVVNTEFYYTINGKGIPMYLIDSRYDKNSKAMGKSIDIDQVFGHEFGHGFGLPHDKTRNTVMYYSEGGMAEFPAGRDVLRIQAKLGKKIQSMRRLNRWLRWLFIRSNKF